MSQPPLKFESVLGPNIALFVRHHRALGRRYDSEVWTLRLLDRFLVQSGIKSVEDISPVVVDAFLASRPRRTARSFNVLLGIVQHLFEWLTSRGVLTQSTMVSQKRRRGVSRVPFIFDLEQARRLVEAASRLQDCRSTRLRGLTYRMVFALLYGLGLRVGEVRRLQVRDVDRQRQLLVIRDTKFSKSRLVPHGPVLAQELYTYLDERARYGGAPDKAPAFSVQRSRRDQPFGRSSIGTVFRGLLPGLGLPTGLGGVRPRLHDLRHSFAVGTLLRWYREGLDPADRLLHLSTFLGHVQPESTAVYLTITVELLHAANERFERFCSVEEGAL